MDPAPLASQLYISIISNSGPPQAQALSGWQWGLSPHGLLCNPLTTSTPLKTHSIVLNSTEHYLVPMCCMLSRFKRCSPSASSIPGISSERSSILARPAVTPGLKYTPLGPNLSGPCRYLIHLEDSPGESPAPGAWLVFLSQPSPWTPSLCKHPQHSALAVWVLDLSLALALKGELQSPLPCSN